jgi:hypothetical protein
MEIVSGFVYTGFLLVAEGEAFHFRRERFQVSFSEFGIRIPMAIGMKSWNLKVISIFFLTFTPLISQF